MGLTDKLLTADTRDILSLGTLLILGWGVYTSYFPAEVVAPMIAMVLSFWFSQKSNHST